MKKIKFHKISGSGNDFIISDNRDSSIELSQEQIVKLCRRHTGIGADGLILLNRSEYYDFAMQYFNDDGNEAEMCGNGGRSIVLFAYINNIIDCRETVFSTKDDVHHAEIKNPNIVKLQLAQPRSIEKNKEIEISKGIIKGDFLNTGVPHFVTVLNEIETEDIDSLGREIRNSKAFAPAGTNVDFIKKQDGYIRIRTYERGVEGETLACGTGSVASALSASWNMGVDSPVLMKTQGGEILTVYFDSKSERVYLEGRVTPVYKAELMLDV